MPAHRSVPRLLLATLGVPAVAIAGGWLTRQALAPRLPDPIAVHWGVDGPDRSAGLTGFTTAALLISAGVALLGTALAVAAHYRGGGLGRAAIAFHAGAACFPAAILLATLLGNLDLTHWEQAPAPVAVVAVLLGVSGAGAAAGFLVAGSARRGSRAEAGMPAAGAEDVNWSGGATNTLLVWTMLPVPVVLITLALVGGTGVPAPLYVIVAAVGVLAALGLGKLRAQVDRTGVSVELGLLRFPRGHFALAEIAEAEVRTLTFWGAGGVGYRVNPVSGDVAYKLRGGRALTLVLRTGRNVFITVDAADEAASAVNALLGRTSQTDAE
ncbi:hypothetical protein SAMN05216266_10313 [Amycolatopsis marina]|uniref:DUF1648 domain-containing protein n=1 Tax=Amycolatopsis marina TaxID=490629 RepID=A0A1I0X8G8_9PSEU|nr:hypothetical protein [Amycolatopsis marina]SFA97325.1 hypothetical protein SAMN05216266_10313 [Amycolatopsis marina]